MKVILKGVNLILVPEGGEEASSLAAWKQGRAGHVFGVAANDGTGLVLRDLGLREDACNVPINVSSRSTDGAVRLIGNFAPTPFELDGRTFASVESFWQGLKFEDGPERRRIAGLDGPSARREGEQKGYGATVSYGGAEVVVGTRAHWDLMERACRAKFAQDEAARSALLATGTRPLTHRTRRDSRAIPGVIMADIWMRIRRELQDAGAPGTSPRGPGEDQEDRRDGRNHRL